MAFTIRPARPDEHDVLGEITAAAYLDDGLLDFGDGDPYLAVLRDVSTRAAHAEVLAAVDDEGRVLGGVTFVGSQGRYADLAGPDEAEFRMLAVAPAGRGQGVGSALVAACLERATALGRRRVVLSTQPVMLSAHRVYERFGFVRAPERDWYPLDDLLLWAYVLELPRPDDA